MKLCIFSNTFKFVHLNTFSKFVLMLMAMVVDAFAVENADCSVYN
jgi:hypothetical protein